MSEAAVAAVLALVVAFLPLLLVGLVIVILAVALCLLLWFVEILEQPIRCWFYYVSVLLDIVVLVPLGVISLIAMAWEPQLWAEAKMPILVFSGVLLVPTVILHYVCQTAKKKLAVGGSK